MNTFDPDKHEYRMDGVIVPSVTQVIEGMGFTDTRFYKDYDRTRGRYIHAACALLAADNLNWDSLDERIRPEVEAFGNFFEKEKVEILETEKMMFSDTHRVAGTMDIFCRFEGRPAIMDTKSGGILPIIEIQTGGYSVLLHEISGVVRPGRFGLQLKEDGTYRLIRCRELQAEQHFLVLLNTYKLREYYERKTNV